MAFVPNFTTTPSDLSSWPTLGSMISTGKRVVIFMDYYSNQSAVPYILDEFSFMWETPFDQTDSNFPCVVDRPPGLKGQIPKGRLSVINHFLDTTLTSNILVPDRSALDVTNGVSGPGSLGQQADDCAQIYGAYPNFFLVDCITLSFKADGSLRRNKRIRIQSRCETEWRAVHSRQIPAIRRNKERSFSNIAFDPDQFVQFNCRRTVSILKVGLRRNAKVTEKVMKKIIKCRTREPRKIFFGAENPPRAHFYVFFCTL